MTSMSQPWLLLAQGQLECLARARLASLLHPHRACSQRRKVSSDKMQVFQWRMMVAFWCFQLDQFLWDKYIKIYVTCYHKSAFPWCFNWSIGLDVLMVASIWANDDINHDDHGPIISSAHKGCTITWYLLGATYHRHNFEMSHLQRRYKYKDI